MDNFAGKRKSMASRLLEVLLSFGIPTIGFIGAADIKDWPMLAWVFPLSLLVAVHVITINDQSFGVAGKRVALLPVTSPGLLWKLPGLFVVVAMCVVRPLFGFLMLAVVINWDVYSLRGKRRCLAGMAHNFIGGGLHYLLGVACVSGKVGELGLHLPEALFFAMAMTAGSMHHDAYDAREDASAGYKTGAVLFAPDRWWRWAVFPFLAAQIPLAHTTPSFRFCFTVSSFVYFLVFFLASCHRAPSRLLWFRSLCRLAFLGGAVGFVVLRFQHLKG